MRATRHATEAALADGRRVEWRDHLWRDHKRAFQDAQRGKCAWCEDGVYNHYGAVEHYAPKSEVMALRDRGTEGDARSRTAIVGRVTDVLHERGYWWLAYEWDNWSFACERCNSWKRCLFPVQEDPHPAPERGHPYTSLLLDPLCDDDDGRPEQHLAFDTIGQIRGLTPRGDATIATCGLDRSSLVQARSRVADDAARHCRRILRGFLHSQPVGEPLEDLRSLGAADRPFAGTVRSIAAQQLEIPWEDIMMLT